ncbi:molecular chaperone [Luteimonas sp. XNQY3]|nr:molecular chaperone [Luteimonas sp. XNQY3]MCD9005491.1 molecular chaperone [Luteimonas sp. XNQY3]
MYPDASHRRTLPTSIAALLLACLCLPQAAAATASLLIWPINPTIASDESATALWLENRGRSPAHLQMRVFEWRQVDGENDYRPQHDVVGSPPMMRIEPGQRQMVRLTRTTATPATGELAYRVIVDEIPTARTQAPDATAPPAGIRFQLRYSIPLFIDGQSTATGRGDTRTRHPRESRAHALSWEITRRDGQAFLDIHNRGDRHVRLTDIGFRRRDGSHVPLGDGHLGYVLANGFARWPLKDASVGDGALEAHVDGHRRHTIPPAPGPSR